MARERILHRNKNRVSAQVEVIWLIFVQLSYRIRKLRWGNSELRIEIES
jgi:hypothetical protein